MHAQTNAERFERLTDQQKTFFEPMRSSQAGDLFSLRRDGSSATFFPREDGIELSMIETMRPEQGKGQASNLLRMVCEAADAAQVTLSLKVEPKDFGDLDKSQLAEWYRRHGFDGDPESMTRLPRPPASG